MGGLADIISTGLRGLSSNLQVENPMAANLQWQQAKNLQAQTQTQQQEQQLNTIKIQQAQQAQQSQQALMRAYTEVYGGGTAAPQTGPQPVPQVASQSGLPGPAGTGPQGQPQSGALAPGMVGVPASALAPQGGGATPQAGPQGAPDGQLPESRSDAVISRALRYGATPAAIQNFQTGQLAYQKSITEAAKDNLELQGKHNALAVNVIAPLAAMPPEQLAQYWGPAMAGLIKNGDITPGDLAKFGVDPVTPPDQNHLKFLVSVLNGHAADVKQELDNRAQNAKDLDAKANMLRAQSGADKDAAETTQKNMGLAAQTIAAAAASNFHAQSASDRQTTYSGVCV